MTFFDLIVLLILGAWEPTALEPLPADTLTRNLPARCEVLLAADVRGAGAGFEALMDRWREPFLGDVPDVVPALGTLESWLGSLERASREHMGMWIGADLTAASLCFRLETSGLGLPEPQFLTVLQGGFGAEAITAVAADVGLVPRPDGTGYADPFGQVMLWSPGPGQLVYGSAELVASTLASAGPVVPAEGSVNARLAALAPYGVRRFAGLDPSLGLSFLLMSAVPQSVAEMVAGLDWALVAGNDDIVYAEVNTRNERVFRDFQLIFQGLGSWLEMAPDLFEATVTLLIGLIHPGDSAYAPPALALGEHREDLLALLRASGALEAPIVETDADGAGGRVTLTVSESRGVQLLIRQLAFLSFLASRGVLPETVRAFANIPSWWSDRMLRPMP